MDVCHRYVISPFRPSTFAGSLRQTVCATADSKKALSFFSAVLGNGVCDYIKSRPFHLTSISFPLKCGHFKVEGVTATRTRRIALLIIC